MERVEKVEMFSSFQVFKFSGFRVAWPQFSILNSQFSIMTLSKQLSFEYLDCDHRVLDNVR